MPYATVAVGLYLISFILPVYRGSGDHTSVPGWFAFIVTLLGMRFEGKGAGFHPGWFANPAFWIGITLLYFKRPRLATACGVAATLLAATFLKLLLNPADRLLIGYYIWLASMIALASSAWVSSTSKLNADS